MSFYSRTCAIKHKHRGVTLLEALVTLSIIVIAAAFLWPRYATLSRQAEAVRVQKQWAETLALARLQALQLGETVVLCPSADGAHCATDWSLGWLLTTEEGVRLFYIKPPFRGLHFRGRVVPVNPTRLLFDENGVTSNAQFWLCLDGERTPVWAMRLSRWGRMTPVPTTEIKTLSCQK